MGRHHKDELTRSQIDRRWPHQVALPERLSMGDRFFTITNFCENLSLCPRRPSFFRDGEGWSVYCFGELAHAELFRARFGGETIDKAHDGG